MHIYLLYKQSSRVWALCTDYYYYYYTISELQNADARALGRYRSWLGLDWWLFMPETNKYYMVLGRNGGTPEHDVYVEYIKVYLYKYPQVSTIVKVVISIVEY